MSERDETEERVHYLLGPLRAQRVQVSDTFTENVAQRVEALDTPSLVDVFGGFVLDSINAVSPRAQEEDEEADDD